MDLTVGYMGAEGRQFGFPFAAADNLDDTGIVTEFGAYGVLAARAGMVVAQNYLP